MQQRVDGRRRVEGIGQPHVQRKLCRLAHGADENQQGDGGHGAHFQSAGPKRNHGLSLCGAGEELAKIQRAEDTVSQGDGGEKRHIAEALHDERPECAANRRWMGVVIREQRQDRKSTRLNSSHSQISYAVFCLKKKKKEIRRGSAEECYEKGGIRWPRRAPC